MLSLVKQETAAEGIDITELYEPHSNWYIDSLWAGRCGDRIQVGGEISHTHPGWPTQPPIQWVLGLSWG